MRSRSATRAALLGDVWLGGIAMLAPERRPRAARTVPVRPNQADNNVAVLDTSTNTIVSPSR